MKRLVLIVLAVLCVGAGSARAADDVMVVFDGSNSMWGQIDGVAKIEIARDVMGNLMGDWVEGTNLGLMAYGHRREGDCTDIEVIIPPGSTDRETFLDAVADITPRGKTPLTSAIEKAAETLAYRDRPATVVVISDGIESCERDPCALADDLERSGVGFTAHVVGFGLESEQEQQSLACIADRTGGQFLAASDADQLGDALDQVSTAVAQAEPAPEPDPAPAPEPEAPAVNLIAPQSALAGALVPVEWTPIVNDRDYITIVAPGADEGTYTNYIRAEKESGSLTAPTETGQYEVRYVRQEDDRTLASRDIEITEPEVSVTAPETALAGSTIDVSWSKIVNGRDYITIVPAGADEGTYTNYVRADRESGTLTVAGDPGVYEVRYVLNAGDRTLASTPVEVRAPQTSVSAPETALAGSVIDVSWSEIINARDYITIVPADADAGSYTEYVRAEKESGSLTVPGDPGMYEVRYVLNENDQTLATTPVEVTVPEVSVSAPEAALAGSVIDVSWSAVINGRDYITIVPAGADEGTYTNYVRADRESGSLTVPADPGLYEVRYILNKNDQTLATTPVEVSAPEVTIEAPESALAGSPVDVSWSAIINGRDYITIVPAGADAGSYTDYVRAEKESGSIMAPADPGLYEVRYVLNEGDRTLASRPIELSSAEIGLKATETVRAGDPVDIAWSGDAPNGRDYITIVPMGAEEGTYTDYVRTESGNPVELTAPETPGIYEVRYVLDRDKRILARAQVEVVSADATLNTGGTLEAPEAAAAGETVGVNWSSESDGSLRIAFARADQADFTWIDAKPTSTEPPLMFTMPEEPGSYEFRLLDVSNQTVLSRAVIAIE